MLADATTSNHLTAPPQVIDVVGIGFGPSNIAVAIALDEYNQSAPDGFELTVKFFERHPELRWHPGMLFDDASMQVSFLKDLATFRNPLSPFTFVNFLKAADRLVDFTNRGSMEPLRVEFVAYLRWAAEQLSSSVAYSSSVTAVTPVFEEESSSDLPRIGHFELTIESEGGVQTVRARNVVISAGLQPRLPDGVSEGERVWHSADFLSRIATFEQGSSRQADPQDELVAARSFAVFGSGQSSAEVALHLYERFPDATVHLVSSRFGLAPSDQGPLVNQVFDPATVDLIFDADPAVRERLDSLHRNSNNSVASTAVIREIFDLQYRDKWIGVERLRFHRMTKLETLSEECDGLRMLLRHELAGEAEELLVDAAVFGTGYRVFDSAQLLGSDAELLCRDSDGLVEVERDCRARLRAEGDAGLYLVGQSEHLHGISSTLLSNVAVRAGEIADSLVARHLVAASESALQREGSHV